MTTVELILCIVAVMASSTSQLCIKFASSRISTFSGLSALGAGGILMIFSVLAAIWVLRTVQLSQLVPFASCAYILVPLGGRFFFW